MIIATAGGFFRHLDAGKWADIGQATIDTLLMLLGSLPLTLDERANLQTLWNDVCRRTGAANNCAAGRGNALAALNPSEMARLQA
ncbi:hypothetical protein, partial [Klebsiella pneumoniae]|uniref:hypothetical protein n=1 Tax=Klebsiella pneumoniae TaxID=573 RepID=UPI0037C04D35